MIKVFGIGNILLGDDGIGVKVVEKLNESIKSIGRDIEVIIGETDYLYCLNEINKEDIVVIIDSTYLNINAGEVSYFTLKECSKFLSKFKSQHENNLLKAIITEKENIKGYLIGIEIDKVDYSLELSKALDNKFNNICVEVLKYIKEIYINNA